MKRASSDGNSSSETEGIREVIRLLNLAIADCEKLLAEAGEQQRETPQVEPGKPDE